MNKLDKLINKNSNLVKKILDRELHDNEKILIIEMFLEEKLNSKINVLKNNLLKNNCYIYKLTKLEGNCLFESLLLLNITNNCKNDNNIIVDEISINTFRNNLCYVLQRIKNNKNLFYGTELSAEEIFINMNEIEFYKNCNGEIQKYDYDNMIDDLRTNNSWERLPTELILMIISKIYSAKIFIHHSSSEYISEINTNSVSEIINEIRLGLINEEHYVPVKKGTEEYTSIKEYNIKKLKYYDWIIELTKNKTD